MLVSTKGRYALRVVVDLAEHYDGSYIPIKDVAKRQELSLKYLERIMPVLSKNSIVDTAQGKGGGYRLHNTPESFTIGQILRLAEGDLAPVACLKENAAPCSRMSVCRTYSMWKGVNDLVQNYFDGITIRDLMAGDEADNYVI